MNAKIYCCWDLFGCIRHEFLPLIVPEYHKSSINRKCNHRKLCEMPFEFKTSLKLSMELPFGKGYAGFFLIYVRTNEHKIMIKPS